MHGNTKLYSLLLFILFVNFTIFTVGVFRFVPDIFQQNDVLTRPLLPRRRQHRQQQQGGQSTKDEPTGNYRYPKSAVPIGVPMEPAEDFLVPNVVHYIWYNTEPRPLQFHHMLSILSAHKTLQPDVIYFHTNIEPTGQYWSRILALSTIKVMHREPPLKLFGEKLKGPFYYTSYSNVDRVKILMEYGGIYLDFDVLITRPFDDLRRYQCTIGREHPTKACGSVIVCARDSPFLLLWINSYLDDYQITEWAYNTGQVPFNLARRYPHLVHLDEDRINRPNFEELDQIWGPKRFAWQRNYAVHLWYRLWKDQSPYFDGMEPNDDNIKMWNSTFGEMARTIMYGRKEMMAFY